jgi:hypothetical protein
MQFRPASAAPAHCTPPFPRALAIAPETATVEPNGTVAFTASGGTGSGYVWTLWTNRSGASLDAAGQYRAGKTGGVTDIVKVTDSYGEVATRNVTVTGATVQQPQKSHGGCATEGGGLLAALGAAAAAAHGARKRRARRSSLGA